MNVEYAFGEKQVSAIFVSEPAVIHEIRVLLWGMTEQNAVSPSI